MLAEIKTKKRQEMLALEIIGKLARKEKEWYVVSRSLKETVREDFGCYNRESWKEKGSWWCYTKYKRLLKGREKSQGFK